MPRFMKDSDDDAESKIGRKTRMLFTQAVDSPIRRSSRLKQSAKQSKYSPDSESDGSNISNSQPTRSTRQRTATMDSIVTNALKRSNVRKISVSSDASEVMDIDVIGTPKKITRSSASVGTPTRTSSRVANKHLTRARSEAKSPPLVRTTRRTRANSVDPEATSDQSRSLPSTPIKMRKRASILSLQSPVKEEAEEKEEYKQVDSTLIEVDEPTNSENSYTTSDEIMLFQRLQISKIRKSIDKEKVGQDNNQKIVISSDSSKSEDKVHNITVISKTITKEQSSSIQNQESNDNITAEKIPICDTSSQKHKKEDKSDAIESDENLIEVEAPLVHKQPLAKQLIVKLENFLNVAVDEQKRSPSNKENQIMNTISSAQNNSGPVIATVTSLNKALTSVFTNRSLNEKESSKSPKNELNLSKRRQSRDSIEATAKQVSTETADNVGKMIDTPTSSLNSSITSKKRSLDWFSKNDVNKTQNVVLDVSSTLSSTTDTNKDILSQDNGTESNEKIALQEKASVENINDFVTETASKSNEFDINVSNQATSNEMCDISYSSGNGSKRKNSSSSSNEKNPTLAIANDNENEIKIKSSEEQNIPQNKDKDNKSLNKSIQTADTDSNNLGTPIRVNTSSCNDEPIAIDELFASQSDNSKAKENLSDSVEQTVNNSSMCAKNMVGSFLDVRSQASNEDNAEIQIASLTETESPKRIKTVPKQSPDCSKSTKNVDDSDNSDTDINTLFQDIPTAEWKEKIIKSETNVEHDAAPSDSHSMQNESEGECDLVLVDKQAWQAAENMKAANDNRQFSDYDSDDTMLLKSQLDAIQAKNDIKRLSTINELQVDTDKQETVEVKRRKSLTKKRSISKKDDSSDQFIEETENLSSNDKSLNESNKTLNRNSDQSASGLNKSGLMIKPCSAKTHDDIETDQESVVFEILEARKENKSSQELTEKRKSLNKSLKESCLKQNDLSAQNISLNKSQTDVLKESDNEGIHAKENLKKRKRSLNRSTICDINADNDEIESDSKDNSANIDSGKKDKRFSMTRSINKKSKPTNTETSDIDDFDKNDESDESGHKEKVVQSQNLEFETSNVKCSTVSVGSNSNDSSNDNMNNETRDENTTKRSSKSSHVFFANYFNNCEDDDDDNDDKNSIDSDVKREYNLDGIKQKVPDDISGDECRASESEYSDSDDHGSDLADFVVDDDEVEDDSDVVVDDEVEDDNDEIEVENSDKNENTDEEEADEDHEKGDINVEEDEDAEENIKGQNSKVMNASGKNKTIYIETDNTDNEKYVIVKTDVHDIITNNTSGKLSDIYKKKISTEYVGPCHNLSNRKKDVTAKKLHTKEIEETILLDTSGSTSSTKKKRKSNVQCSSKDLTEKVSVKQLNELKKVHTLLDCSTPKSNSSKQHPVINVTPVSSGTTKNKLNVTDEILQHGLPEKKKSKKKLTKENISLKHHDDNGNDKKTILLNSSLSSDLLEVGNTKKVLKATKLRRRTISDTHIETPTLKHLMKEKLNESAPMMNLKAEIYKAEKKQLHKEENITRKADYDSDEVPNLALLFNDDNTEEPNRRKGKKRKKQAEETLSENIIAKNQSQNVIESDVTKKEKKKRKKKRNELIQMPFVEDNTDENTRQTKEKKKKRKLNTTERNETVSENNVPYRNIETDKVKLVSVQDKVKHSEKKKKSKTCLESENPLPQEDNIVVKQKNTRQEVVKTKSTLQEKPKKQKKKEEKISQSQNKVAKLKSEKLQLKNIKSNIVESKSALFDSERNEALEAIKYAIERIKFNQEVKKRKKREDAERKNIQEQEMEIPTKQQKNKHDEKERRKVLSIPTTSLKRLSNDVLENLSDVPMRTKKKPRLSQNEKQNMPSLSMNNIKFTETKIRKKNFIPLSSFGSTTQFTVVNLQKAKKKQLSKIAASAAATYKSQMFNRNSREPISYYLKSLEKQSVLKNTFPTNTF